jgi:hypothetical protein
VSAQKAQRATTATADSEGPSDNDVIDLAKERVRKEALQSIAREYGNLDQMGPGALNQLQAMALVRIWFSLVDRSNVDLRRQFDLAAAFLAEIG